MVDNERIEAMVRWYRQLAASKAEIEASMSSIVSEINEMVDVGWSTEVDGVPASKRKGRRQFSIAAAVALLTPEERAAHVVTQFDEKGIREFVESRGLLESCMEDVNRAPSVILR